MDNFTSTFSILDLGHCGLTPPSGRDTNVMCSLSVHITVNRQHKVGICCLSQHSSCLTETALFGGSESVPARTFLSLVISLRSRPSQSAWLHGKLVLFQIVGQICFVWKLCYFFICIASSFPVKDREFSVHYCIQADSGVHVTSHTMGTGGRFTIFQK